MKDIKIIKKFMPIFTNYYRNIFLGGGRGSSKSFTAGFFCLVNGSARYEKILCCREIQNSIKDSVIAQLKHQIDFWEMPYYSVGKESIKHLKTGTEFLFNGLYRNEESIKSIPNISIAWVEEAVNISKKSISILIPTVRAPKSRLIWTFNPFEETDPFFQEFMINKRADSFYEHTTYKDNPFCSDVIKNEAELLFKNAYDDYLHIYGGEFSKQSVDNVLKSSDIYKAFDRVILIDGGLSAGVDCARYGNDSSSVSVARGLKQIKLNEYNKLSVTELARQVMVDCNFDKKMPIKIDCGGLGAGVYDILKDEGYNVFEVNFGGAAKEPTRYENVISEMWGEFKEIVNTVALVRNERSVKELSTRKYKMTNRNKFRIESKDDYKKRGYKSPDIADCTLLNFYAPAKQLSPLRITSM